MLDAVSVVGEDVKDQMILPTAEESFTVCIVCGHVMGFNADGTIRPLTDAEMVQIAGDRRMLAIQRARQIAQKLHPDSIGTYHKYRDPNWQCGTSLSTPRGQQSKSSTPTILHLPYRPLDSKSDK